MLGGDSGKIDVPLNDLARVGLPWYQRKRRCRLNFNSLGLERYSVFDSLGQRRYDADERFLVPPNEQGQRNRPHERLTKNEFLHDCSIRLVGITLMPFSGECKRERSDRCVRPSATTG